jgi:hypothetical protein
VAHVLIDILGNFSIQPESPSWFKNRALPPESRLASDARPNTGIR